MRLHADRSIPAVARSGAMFPGAVMLRATTLGAVGAHLSEAGVEVSVVVVAWPIWLRPVTRAKNHRPRARMARISSRSRVHVCGCKSPQAIGMSVG